jgi:hypothetical protein
MDFQIFQIDMQSHLADFVDHLPTLQLASIYKTASESSKTLNLIHYYPQSIEEVEIQRFNLNGEIPHRLSTVDSIAVWLLETESLVRENVCKYLTQRSSSSDGVSSDMVLEALSKKICSLDVSEGFIEGMRVHLPICGGIIPSNLTVYEFIHEESKLSILLKAYVRGHLLYSKSPIIDAKFADDEVINALASLAEIVIQTYRSLASSDKPWPAINNDFQVATREVFKKQLPAVTMDMKTINEMLVTISANNGQLVPLYIPEKTPSYFYASVVKSGWIRLGFNTDIEVMMKCFVRLCNNALYIFVDSHATNAQGFIPLQYLRPQLSDTLNTYSTINLLPVLDSVIPYVAMKSAIYKRDSLKWSAPEEVTYHSRFILDILDEELVLNEKASKIINTPMITSLPSVDSSKESKAKFRKHVEVVAQWLEVLEECSWDSRYTDEEAYDG